MDDGERDSQNFYEIQRIDRENAVSLDKPDSTGDYHHVKRVHPAIYAIVTNKLATYMEMKYNCTVEDFLDLYEICLVNLHNKATSLKG